MERNDPANNLIPGLGLVLLGFITFTGSMNLLGILFTLSYKNYPNLFVVIASLATIMVAASLTLFYASLPFFRKVAEQSFIPDE
jgi:hypothetical protein